MDVICIYIPPLTLYVCSSGYGSVSFWHLAGHSSLGRRRLDEVRGAFDLTPEGAVESAVDSGHSGKVVTATEWGNMG